MRVIGHRVSPVSEPPTHGAHGTPAHQPMTEEEARNVTPLDLLSSKNYTTKEIRDHRYGTCASCEHIFKPTHTCKKCGCFMALKTWITDATCPIGAW